MTAATVPVYLPEPLFQKLKRVADRTHRSVDDIAATSLEVALPSVPNVPPDIAHELAAMHLLSDEALWAATAPSLSTAEESCLNHLNAAAGERDLTPTKQAEQQRVILAYRRSVLRRAKALAILAQRGHRLPLPTDVNMVGYSGN